MTNNVWAVAALAAIIATVAACDGSKSPPSPPPLIHTKPSPRVQINADGYSMTVWIDTIKAARPTDSDTVEIHLEKIQGKPYVPYTLIRVKRNDFPDHFASFELCGGKIVGCSLATLEPNKTWVVRDASGRVSPLASTVVNSFLIKPMKLYDKYLALKERLRSK